MSTLRVILYSKQRTQRILYVDADGVMTSDIERTYRSECDVESCRPGGVRIRVNEVTRNALMALERKYDQMSKCHIRKLRGFISKLQDGDSFYYFNEEKTSIVERRIAFNLLKLENCGVPYSATLHNLIFEHYSRPNLMYQFLSYGYDGLEEWVGEEETSRRVCRFCGKSVPEVTFEKDAHAIQDALGNKLLFCHEECDTCNHDLAVVEDQFRVMMDFRRSIFRIPRKDTTKAAKVVGKDFIILADTEGNPHLYLMQERLNGVDTSKTFMHHFELKAPIINEQMYKALCKMVIDMLPSNELSHFENTIRWITSNDFVADALPSIWLACLPTEEPVHKQPTLDIFINNRNVRQEAPYCTAIIWIYDIAYLFVMPLVDVDCGQYKYERQLEAHFKWMKEWTGVKEWYKQDSYSYNQSTPWVDWPVDPTLDNVHIVHESDVVFDECKAVKVEVPYVSMPDVDVNDLSLVKNERVWFESIYDAEICDKDFVDITLHIEGPLFMIDSERKQIRVSLNIEANDTTDRIKFYKCGFVVDIHVDRFDEYVSIDYCSEGLSSFVCHYQLRDELLKYSLAKVELEMKKLRRGTQFEKCNLEKLLQINERLAMSSVYVIQTSDNKCYIIKDSQIHGVGYES